MVLKWRSVSEETIKLFNLGKGSSESNLIYYVLF